jgi:hypothetical protein
MVCALYQPVRFKNRVRVRGYLAARSQNEKCFENAANCLKLRSNLDRTEGF